MKIELNINGISHTADAQPWVFAFMLKYFGFNSDLVFPEAEEIIDLLSSEEFIGKLTKALSQLRFSPIIYPHDLSYADQDNFILNVEIGDLLGIVYTVLAQSTSGLTRMGQAVNQFSAIALPELELAPQPIELVATEPEQSIDQVLNDLADKAEVDPISILCDAAKILDNANVPTSDRQFWAEPVIAAPPKLTAQQKKKEKARLQAELAALEAEVLANG